MFRMHYPKLKRHTLKLKILDRAERHTLKLEIFDRAERHGF